MKAKFKFSLPATLSVIVKAGSGLRFSFEVRDWTEMEIWCVKTLSLALALTLACLTPNPS